MSTDVAVEIDGQYRAMKEGAGVLDRSSRGKLVVSGPDAAEFLQGQLTNDVEALQPDTGCYAALLDRKGHMQADMRVLRLGNGDLWLDTEPDAKAAVERAGSGPLSPEDAQRSQERDGVEIRAVATDLGVDLIVRAAQAGDARRLLDSEAVDVTETAAEIVRVESGTPRFGREMTTATIPQEAGIAERAVSFTKGCYIGQETVARLHYKGRPNRHLRGLRLEAPVTAGEAIVLGDREVGTVGTAVLSPAHGSIALAVIRREAEPGAHVEIGDDRVAAQVVDVPF